MPRPRKPDSLKMISGTARPSRQKPKTSANALAKLPSPPRGMSKEAGSEWKRLAPIVAELGTVSTADLRAFELLCSTLATAREAEATFRKEGMTLPTGSGGYRTHPAIKVMETARSQAARLLEQFGLTPKARNYVSPAPKGADTSKSSYWDHL